MGWLLGCFTCTGKHNSKASHLHRDRTKISSGKPSFAAVAHATSPEDLYNVRRVSADFASAVSNGYNEGKLFESQGQTKKMEVTKSPNPKRNEAIKMDLSKAQTLQENEELESLRTKLMKEAVAAKKLSDEIKYLKACQSLLESPSGSFRVTFDSLDEISSGQVDCSEHAWLISPVITPIQPRSLHSEASSSPSSRPWHRAKEGFSVHTRGPKNGDIEDNFQGSIALQCAELNLFRVMTGVESEEGGNGSLPPTQLEGGGKVHALASHLNIPSPPWAFSEAKLGTPTQLWEEGELDTILPLHNIPSPPWIFSKGKLDIPTQTFASSEDLLQEHLDVSSLLEDSTLITNWELSLGEQSVEEGLGHGHSLDPSQELPPEFKWEAELHSSGQESQTDDHSFGPLEDGPEVTTLKEMVSSESYQALSPPKFILAKAEAQPDAMCEGEQVCREDKLNTTDVETQLFEAKLYNDDDGYLHHDDSEVHEVLLSHMHVDMRPVQEAESYEYELYPLGKEHAIEPTVVDPAHHLPQHPLTTCNSETNPVETPEQGKALVVRDAALHVSSSPIEGSQRKKSKLSSSESIVSDQQATSKVEHEHGPAKEDREEDTHLLDKTCEVSHGSFSGDEAARSSDDVGSKIGNTSTLSWPSGESSSKQNSNSSPASSPPSNMETLPKSLKSSQYSTRLDDDRPILGTVAAHWSPMSTTEKWWDGKGILNSTNKYKEDQKVSWHAVPFEVRLEQALANQDSLVSK